MKHPAKHPAKKTARSKKMKDEEPELESMAKEEPEQTAVADAPSVDPTQVKFGSGITQQAKFQRQLVVDCDFGVSSIVEVIHSFGSDLLFITTIQLGAEFDQAPYPAFEIVDSNRFRVNGTAGIFRVFVSVLPQ